jgi:hypothetical protein
MIFVVFFDVLVKQYQLWYWYFCNIAMELLRQSTKALLTYLAVCPSFFCLVSLSLGLTFSLNFLLLVSHSFFCLLFSLTFFCLLFSLSLSRRVFAGVNDAPIQSLLHLHSHHLPVGLESNRGRDYMGTKHCT